MQLRVSSSGHLLRPGYTFHRYTTSVRLERRLWKLGASLHARHDQVQQTEAKFGIFEVQFLEAYEAR